MVRAGVMILFSLGGALLAACTDHAEVPTVSGSTLTMTLRSPADTIYVGQSVQMQAVVGGATGSDRGPIVWIAEPKAVVSVNTSGVVTGLQAGNAAVSAMLGAAFATVPLTVIAR